LSRCAEVCRQVAVRCKSALGHSLTTRAVTSIGHKRERSFLLT
jgi:hypothetical protein